MDKNKVLEGIKEVRENSKKRNFNQTFDLIVNFKDLDLKKKSLDIFLTLSHSVGRSAKVCAIVGKELEKKAKGCCDEVILENELKKYSDKKLIKKLAKSYDFFVAQANLMGQIASVFGRILGPMGKMPNPKFGGVLSPVSEVKPTVDKFRKSIRLVTKKEPIIKTVIGKEDMKDEDVVENFLVIYDHIVHDLPRGDHNIKNVLLKLTMGKPVKIGAKVKEGYVSEKRKIPEQKGLKEKKIEIKEDLKEEIVIENKK